MLRMGRLKESIYKRSVEKQLHNDPRASAPFMIRRVTVDGWTMAPERLVWNMMNEFFAAGGMVSQISLTVTMPEETEESQFRQFTAGLGRLCKEYGIWVTVDEARVREDIDLVLIDASGVGVSLSGKKVSAGMDLVLAGSIAREGAAILARDRESSLKERFADFYIEAAQKLFDAAAMPAVGKMLAREDLYATAVREGGIFAGLWELAAAGKVGLNIDLAAIPIRQHTVEVCEYFNLNPYMLLSGGCILIAAHHGESLVSALRQVGIQAAVIGQTTAGNDRIIRYDDEIRYLEPPKTDEIYRAYKDR